ncbi:9757_t:CDS:1, partial [Gigaspora rosea]
MKTNYTRQVPSKKVLQEKLDNTRMTESKEGGFLGAKGKNRMTNSKKVQGDKLKNPERKEQGYNKYRPKFRVSKKQNKENQLFEKKSSTNQNTNNQRREGKVKANSVSLDPEFIESIIAFFVGELKSRIYEEIQK